jgi:transcription elongation factor GreA
MDQPVLSQSARRSLRQRLEMLESDQIPRLEALAEKSREDVSVLAALGSARAERAELVQTLAAAAHLEDLPYDPEIVEVGDTVTLRLVGAREPERFTITVRAAARVNDSWISSDSPMARALLGHRAGDAVEVQGPVESARYRIVGIERSR